MPNSINYAEQYSPELLAINIQNALTSPFIVAPESVQWLSANTFHITGMSVSGFKNHDRAGGWNKGEVTQRDNPLTCNHDRDISVLVDKADVMDSNGTASPEKISLRFQQTQVAPEVDALFYERVAAAATTAGLYDATARSAFTNTNALEKLKAGIGKVKRYRGSLIAYVDSEIMDLIEEELVGKASVQWTSVSGMELSVETRVAVVDGTPIMDVIDDERFYTAQAYATKNDNFTGFKPKEGAYKINFLIASTASVITVPRVSSIYLFAPGEHTEGDGYLYQNRQLWDTFVLKNDNKNAVDCVYVSRDTTAVEE